jgi:hypothetical protein
VSGSTAPKGTSDTLPPESATTAEQRAVPLPELVRTVKELLQ